MLELAEMIFRPMPRVPRERAREVRVPVEGAHFPERCPGCGAMAIGGTGR